eukprot:44846-Amphidinium_carterae.3
MYFEFPVVDCVSEGTVADVAVIGDEHATVCHVDGDEIEILVDCGSTETCCGPQHFQSIPVVRSPARALKTASGDALKHYGHKHVCFQDGAGSKVEIEFEVCNVTRPILSVGKLVDRNVEVTTELHAAGGEIRHRKKRTSLPLRHRWGLFFLPLFLMNGGAQSMEIPHGMVAPAMDEAVEEEHFDMVDAKATEQEEPFAAPASAPGEPSEADRLFHNLTHVPYQPWCSLCLRTRARDDPHRRGDVEQVKQKPVPVIQIDYCFMNQAVPKALKRTKGPILKRFLRRRFTKRRKSREQEENHTVLTGIDSVYAMTCAVPCQQKGSGDSYAVACLEAYCRQLNFEECYLQCDPEPAICELRNKVCTKIPRMRPRETPVGSKGSNGRVCESYGVELPTQHPLIGWCIRHASWLHDRFQPARVDGRTAYYRLHHLDYGSSVLPFGETIVWRNPYGVEHLKLKEHWGYGLWLGREITSDSHVVERADKQLLLAMVGGPGHLTRRGGKETLAAPPTPRVPGTPVLVPATPVHDVERRETENRADSSVPDVERRETENRADSSMPD